jgi:hypothetical protein
MNVLDLGSGHRFTFAVNAAGERVGGIHDHPAGSDLGKAGDGRCAGSVTFRGFAERGESEWDVVQQDPLTLSPSLLCRACGSHGWIRSGKWEIA